VQLKFIINRLKNSIENLIAIIAGAILKKVRKVLTAQVCDATTVAQSATAHPTTQKSKKVTQHQ
jgi:protein required for attachment to host cells